VKFGETGSFYMFAVFLVSYATTTLGTRALLVVQGKPAMTWSPATNGWRIATTHRWRANHEQRE